VPAWGNRFYQLPSGGGGGGGGGAVVLDYSDRSSLTTNGIDDGAITMNGEYFDVPISTGTRQNGFSSALRVGFAVPPELLDGTAYGLRWSVQFAGTPPSDGIVRAQLGLYASNVGIGGGIEHRGGGLFRPNASVLSGSNVGGINQAEPVATGVILLPGLWNGANSVGGACAAQVNAGTTGASACNQNGQGTYNAASMELVAAFGSGSLSGATDVLSVRLAYQLLQPWTE
jgi:hypothetical protein